MPLSVVLGLPVFLLRGNPIHSSITLGVAAKSSVGAPPGVRVPQRLGNCQEPLSALSGVVDWLNGLPADR